MSKKWITRAVFSALLATSFMLSTSGAGFDAKNTYVPDMFTDVPESEWFSASVGDSYELGFMKGTGDGIFSPNDTMTVAEAVTIASRVHDAYHGTGTAFSSDGENWYDSYVAYAMENGIITEEQFSDFDRAAKRHEMASIFAASVPEDFLKAKNTVDEIPDVPSTNSYFHSLILLYRAGVIMGNDEFGTFKPNNNVTRAEAAAIITRVALPENRLEKTLTDANYGDAFYLVNDGNSYFQAGNIRSTNISPWYTDNRMSGGSTYGNVGLSDFNSNGTVYAWRDIEDVSEGLLGVEFKASLQNGENGVFFRITDDEKNALINLETQNGAFLFNGKETGLALENPVVYVKIKADLDKNTATLYIDGVKANDTFSLEDITAARVYVGSDDAGTAVITLDRVDIYKDYLVNEIFLDPVDSALTAWDVTGDAKVVYRGGQRYNDVNSAELSTGAVASQSFPKISGNVIFESYMIFPEAEDTGSVALKSGDVTVASLTVTADGIFAPDGTKLRHHTNNIWQCLRMEADTTTGKVIYKINGKKVGEFPFDGFASTVDTVEFTNNAGTCYFDDVKVSLSHEYDDYCPVPKPINTKDDYDVLLNICSLWHEGSHSGWGCESAFADIEPSLGYYDEGIPEVADWEIKYWVENGIDVAHFCWYPPSADINEPIKRSNLNWALHDGYFNAKYSDLVKFMLMWENNEVNCHSLDQFKDYIWKYWVEYYFTDDRYYTIDNQVVMTVWDYRNVITAFGSIEDAKAAIEFMNEDIKQYGFDGMKIFFFDIHRSDAGVFQDLKAIGAEAAYAYHWGQDGIFADRTINRLTTNQGHGILHNVPTVSVGFNNLGWSGVRKPLASLEDHRKVLEFIKNDYLPQNEGWKAKTLIISTWNEYGEGTYVMPVEGLHGFGYLENIAEVITGVTDHSTNVYPTPQQKARLGHMFRAETKTSLDRLDYEKPDYSGIGDVFYEATGAEMEPYMNMDSYEIHDDVITCTTSSYDSAIHIGADSNFYPFDAEEIGAIRITVKTDVSAVSDIYFATETFPDLAPERSFRYDIQPSSDFVTYTIDTSTCENWKGYITSFRLDIVNQPCTFHVSKIELIEANEDAIPYSLYVNDEKFSPYFPLENERNEVYVTADANNGFFSMHNFYYEWSRFTGKLYIAAANGKDITFTVGSDTALVGNKQVELPKAVELKDGLPILPLYVLYEQLGIEYTVDEKRIDAHVYLEGDKDQYADILANRVPYHYEFEIPGDTEDFGPGNVAIASMNGCLKGVATDINGEGHYDPIISIGGLEMDGDIYNTLKIRMKHNGTSKKDDGTMVIYFATKTNPGYSEDKNFKATLAPGSSNGEFVEYVFDLTTNENWCDTITELRIDPINHIGTFEIDYIRFEVDQEKQAAKLLAEEERIARGFYITNGDAEDTENVAFFNKEDESVISIVYDKEAKSNVYNVQALVGYPYFRQSVVWEPGKIYKGSFDIKLTETQSGMTNFSADIQLNLRYTDEEGKWDHVILSEGASTSGWKTIKFSFSIPSEIKSRPNDEIALYLNPVNNEGGSYMIDNFVVEVKD